MLLRRASLNAAAGLVRQKSFDLEEESCQNVDSVLVNDSFSRELNRDSISELNSELRESNKASAVKDRRTSKSSAPENENKKKQTNSNDKLDEIKSMIDSTMNETTTNQPNQQDNC